MDVSYWRHACRSLVTELRTDPAFRRSWLSAAVGRPRAETRSILDLYPQVQELVVPMGDVRFRRSNMDPMEQFVIRALVTILQPRLIVEIGTYDGTTTLALAQSAPEAEIVTLDLPPVEAGVATVPDEADHAAASHVGACFRGRPEASRITQVLGDSRTFDFGPWEGAADLVLVDAGHEYEFVKADTESALRLIRHGGTILWDDYDPGWPGVVRAVDETGLPIVCFTHTDMAALLPATD